MKKLFVLFVFAASAIFVSCSSDDDNASNESLIIGKWEFSQAGSVLNGQEILLPYDHEAPECGKDFLEFRANGIGLETYFYYDDNEDCTQDTEGFIYSIAGNDITLLIDGIATLFEITTLNNNTLKLKGLEIEGDTFVPIVVLNRI